MVGEVGGVRVQPCSQVCVGAGGWMAGWSTLLVTVLIASVGEALPEIIHSIPKDSDSRLYGVEACGGWGWCVEADKIWRRRREKKKINNHPIIKHMKSHCRLQNLNDVCGNSLFSHHMPMKAGRKKGTNFFTTDLHLYLGHIWTVTSEKMETLLKALEKHVRFHTRFFFFFFFLTSILVTATTA